jgi:carboxyl-terminal processing protease
MTSALALFTVLSSLALGIFAPQAFSATDPLSLYDATTSIVTQKFYDQTFRGLPWKKMVNEWREKLTSTSSDQELSDTINSLLSNLHASHTEFLSSSDQEYWAVQSIFSGELDHFPAPQIGTWFVQIGKHSFAQNVFQHSAADQAGIKSGDEILLADGKAFSPIDSFSSKIKKQVVLTIRKKMNGPVKNVSVNLVSEDFQRTLLTATEQSYRVIQQGKKRVAYFHLWSGTHDQFKSALRDAAIKANQEADCLILDFRDGFGGAYPAYLDPLLGEQSVFKKPIVLLINHGVRSGKEWISLLMKTSGRALLVGTQTKGYFLAGSPFQILENKFLLYLAIEKGPENINLEHNGVKPDVEIETSLPFSQGRDAQFESALRLITK